ncbi:YgiT-type zinc finger protein [Desulfobacterales bacterium HSG17]|nr:YgiT-type zinc finger protein [Desulfobacterales bacterium HSG17]
MIACAACHNNMVSKKGIIDLRINGKLYVVKNVAYDACEVCGEKVVSPEVSHDIYKHIKGKEYIEEMIKVPVLDCA